MVTKINFNRQKSQKDARKVRLTGVYKASFIWPTKRTQRLLQFLASRPRGRKFKFRTLWQNHNWLMNKDLLPGIGKAEKENREFRKVENTLHSDYCRWYKLSLCKTATGSARLIKTALVETPLPPTPPHFPFYALESSVPQPTRKKCYAGAVRVIRVTAKVKHIIIVQF